MRTFEIDFWPPMDTYKYTQMILQFCKLFNNLQQGCNLQQDLKIKSKNQGRIYELFYLFFLENSPFVNETIRFYRVYHLGLGMRGEC